MNYQRTGGYLPISAYGLIGDCRSAALVGADGSIDWLCLPRFDDPSVLGRLVDSTRGGYWQVRAEAAVVHQQRYRDLSNVLETIFRTGHGRLTVTDFMPISAGTAGRAAGPTARPRLIRLATCIGGEVRVRNTMRPAPGYGRRLRSGFRFQGDRFHADVDGLHLCFRASEEMNGASTIHHLRAGESVAFALWSAEEGECPRQEVSVEWARRCLRETLEYWWKWGARIRYDGPYRDPVHRSALALKALTYAPSGAIVAAPTTSLPEEVGGTRNWDYRYTWLRDASFTLYAFFQLGMGEEAEAFFRFLARTRIGAPGQALDNFYTLDGGRVEGERELHWLKGYLGSAPVRTGNGAASQLQLDVYGELLDSAYLYARFGGRIPRTLWSELRHIVELAIANWELPDSSIWEVRGGVQHFTYSKMMCWVAVDRGLRLADRFDLPHDSARWRSARRAIHRRVVQGGWNPKLRSFTQTLDGDSLDASLLRMSQVRLLSDRDPRLRSTVDRIAERLREGELVRRYVVGETDDGMPGQEGAFLMCGFWLVDALAHFARVEEAQRLFEQLLCFASPLGLYSEEAESHTGLLLGNFPQAFTHLALIGSAVNIERARHRQLGVRGLRGRQGTGARASR